MGQEQEPEQALNAPENVVTIEDIGPCKKKVHIEIPEETIKTATDKQYKTLQKDAVLPGFRPGRAPRRLLEKRFGKETTEQIKLQLLAEASDAAIKEHKLNIFGEPEVDHENIELPAQGPMAFGFEVEVWPEFDLPNLEGIPVTKARLEVADEQVTEELDQLRKYSGIWAPREEGDACEVDDRILADVSIKLEGVDEPEKLDNTDISVRAHGYIGSIPVEKLDEELVGVKAGDSRQISVEVPKTYFNEEYRGKKAEISVEVKEVKWLKPTDIDAAFLERFGAETEEDLRDSIQTMLDSRLEASARSEMAEQIYAYLLQNTNFDLPLDVVADQASTVLQRQYLRMMQQGLSREKMEEQMADLRASSEDQAKDQLKTFFVIDKVCDKLDIQVSDEEVNGQVAQLAIQRGQRPERMKEQMARDGSLGQFRLEIRQNKCIEKLLESAAITEVDAKEAPEKAKKTVKKKETAPKKTTKKSSTTSTDDND
jgi:trigger factor